MSRPRPPPGEVRDVSGQKLGPTACVVTALGGMIGGGIFAVLGVVPQTVHGATWFAFVLAGTVALCAGHAFNRLNAEESGSGGAVTFIQGYTGGTELAGMTGWTPLFDYIGSMAKSSNAFGSFAVGLDPVPEAIFRLPLRPLVSVAVVAVSLAPPEVVAQHPERALAVAADPFIPYGFTLISLAALFSTGSAINAALFSTGHFAKTLLSADLLPDRVGDSRADGLPPRTVWGIAAVTAAFAAYGGLGAITSFAPLAFIVVFGAVCWVAFQALEPRTPLESAVCLTGAVGPARSSPSFSGTSIRPSGTPSTRSWGWSGR